MRAALYRWIFGAIGSLESDTACRLGGWLGGLAFHLGIRRRVASANLALALGLRGPARRRACLQSFRGLGASFVEVWTLRRGRASAEVAAPHWLDALLRDDRGLVLVTMHAGSWEASAAVIAARRDDLMVYAKAQRDADMDALVNAQRTALGMEVVFARRGGAGEMIGVLRNLRRGGSVGLVADQMPTGDDGCDGYFFDVPTRLHLGPATLARLGKARMVPAVCLRVGAGRNRFYVGRPIAAGTDDPQTVQACMDALAAILAAVPGQYFWQHRRFKRLVDLPPRTTSPWREGLSLLVRD